MQAQCYQLSTAFNGSMLDPSRGSRSWSPRTRSPNICSDKVVEAKSQGKSVGIVNSSQGPSYATVHTDTVPCVTPGCTHYMPDLKRGMVAEEKLICQGCPVHKLDLGANSHRELAALAGNSMHVRCIFVAILAGLAAVDKKKMDKLLQKQAQSKYS